MMVIANSKEIDQWCFDRAAVRHHTLSSVKGHVEGIAGLVNVAWLDRDTGERIEVEYK